MCAGGWREGAEGRWEVVSGEDVVERTVLVHLRTRTSKQGLGNEV